MTGWLRRLRPVPGGPGQGPDRVPRVPDGRRIYAVGDIHGHLASLDALLALIAADSRDGPPATLVFLGDYVDRGPHSREVIDRLLALAGGPVPCRFLLGNHEAAVLDALAAPERIPPWLEFGGRETLLSYGVALGAGALRPDRLAALRDDFATRIPAAHRRFLEGLETSVAIGDYLFVHAGIRPGRALDAQRREDLLWIREPFLGSERWHGQVVVHGHTIVDQPERRFNRIAIDTGAYATGVLTCLALEGTEQRFLQTAESRFF